jgi:predicted transcriptional regulator
MKLSEVKDTLEAVVICGEDLLDVEVRGGAAASDLMSDLLRYPAEGSLILTGLTNIQVLHTAIIAGMIAIIFVRGKKPGEDLRVLADKHRIPILTTHLNMYSSCGRLFQKGLKSIR